MIDAELIARLHRRSSVAQAFNLNVAHMHALVTLQPQQLAARKPISILGSVSRVIGLKHPSTPTHTGRAVTMRYCAIVHRGIDDITVTRLARPEESASIDRECSSTMLSPSEVASLLDPSWLLGGWNLNDEGRLSMLGRAVALLRATPRPHAIQSAPHLVSNADSIDVAYCPEDGVLLERTAYVRGAVLDRLTVVTFETLKDA